MSTFSRNALWLVLAVVCINGCGTASTSKEGWAYLGSDATLRNPPAMRNGNFSDPVWRAESEEKMGAWQQKRKEASDAAKVACARETGESTTPGLWFGYGDAFLACMKSRGWATGFSDPL